MYSRSRRHRHFGPSELVRCSSPVRDVAPPQDEGGCHWRWVRACWMSHNEPSQNCGAVELGVFGASNV